MKIESIKEPRQLDDGTVKASITVSDDDFIPLIQLIKDAKKGDELELDKKKNGSEPKADGLPDFIRSMWTRYAQDVKDAYEKGRKDEYANTTLDIVIREHDKPEVVHESPERQELVTEAHDKVIDNRPLSGSVENMHRDSY